MTVSSVNCRFPKDVAVLNNGCEKSEGTISLPLVFCDMFTPFEESFYVATAELRRKLRTGAVPTIFKLTEHLIGSKRTEASKANQCD